METTGIIGVSELVVEMLQGYMGRHRCHRQPYFLSKLLDPLRRLPSTQAVYWFATLILNIIGHKLSDLYVKTSDPQPHYSSLGVIV